MWTANVLRAPSSERACAEATDPTQAISAASQKGMNANANRGSFVRTTPGLSSAKIRLRQALKLDGMEDTLDGGGQCFPAVAQERGEEPKQAEDFDKGCKYDVEVQVPASGVLESDFITQNLIVRHMSNIRTCPPEERKYRQSKILQSARGHEYKRI